MLLQTEIFSKCVRNGLACLDSDYFPRTDGGQLHESKLAIVAVRELFVTLLYQVVLFG
jgi:hypothetical protein